MSDCILHESLAAALTELGPLSREELHDVAVFMRIDAEQTMQNDAWTQELQKQHEITVGETTIHQRGFAHSGDFVARTESAVSMTKGDKAVPYMKPGPELENYLTEKYTSVVASPVQHQLIVGKVISGSMTDPNSEVIRERLTDEQVSFNRDVWDSYDQRQLQVKELAFETNGKVISDVNTGDLYLDQNGLVSNDKFGGLSTSEALAEGQIQLNGSLTTNNFVPAGTTTDENGKIVGGGGSDSGGGEGECCIFNQYGGGGCGECR